MLTVDEIERAAYANGDVQVLKLLALAEENAESAAYAAEEKIREDAYSEGYAKGEEETLDRNLRQELYDSERGSREKDETIKVLTDAIKRLEAELVGDSCKTVTGRKQYAKTLRTFRYARGLC